MKSYVVMTFYKFVSLNNYESMREPILKVMKENQVKGTIILASEGINGTFCGQKEEIEPLIAFLKSYSGLENLAFRPTYNEFNPFAKAKVKLRKEIVTLGVDGVDPLELSGTHLNPAEWNELISDPEVVLIDTRNDYEVKLGTFKNAINPNTENFRDFPEYVETHLLEKKDKKIAMFCTGGIRCEKSTSYLKKLGFEEVYQLKGGILNYLESMPAEDSLWEGTCFVFDDRVALNHQLTGFEKGAIDTEWKNKHRKKQQPEEIKS
ncbi:rhodanese-related sulfurtransferase [Tatlockia micdadei]|uniref:oxygen-dependent tRNA uridine(34) hydroxylase TrhO n=1 Tax=Legionella micdadei TaxID=451 RepID=UPI0015709181|nr:rhodanese-related sulfurtransferase [Legionella micdadei]NSL18191.1 rhodanese-related sulfurtransferase [Legionella micdadei]